MAADMGLSPETLDKEASPPDKGPGKLTALSGLMERLRGRCGQHKSWNDNIKTMKMTLMNDKRHYSEALDKPNLQMCLDKLHQAMKIINQQSLIERLELICRQLGMVFTPPVPPESHITLNSEMFKVVIVLEGQNAIKDVKVGHHENPTSCEDLLEVLSKGDFDEFIKHLQGLLSIYNMSGDKKQKTKGYHALSSLEMDLNLLAQLQHSINGVANYIHKSPLGIMLPRRGGHPMKLIYCVSPYDLLCKKTRSSYPMTVEAITDNDLGHSVTVCMEPSDVPNKLQTMPLMSVKTNNDGKPLPSFQGVNNINSYNLSASFVLALPQPIPIAKSVIADIQGITGLDVIYSEEKPLLSVLLQHGSDGKISHTKELFVTLPDQHHAYFLNMSVDGCLGQAGALVSKIPFTHPTSVPSVLNLLRQQLMFNSVIQSLIRPSAKKDYKSSLMFEITALSLQYLSAMFEHPLQDSMITVEFDMNDITSVKCRVCMQNRDENICSDDFVSRTFQRCFSIPVTLRAVIDKVREQIKMLVPPEPVVKPVLKPRWKYTSKLLLKNIAPSCATNLNMNNVLQQNIVTNLPNPPPYPLSVDNWAQGSHLDGHKYNVSVPINRTFMDPPPPSEDLSDRQPANTLLATLLDAGSPVVAENPPQNVVTESPMLSKLLEENTSVATNPFPAPNPKRRLTKRKSSKDMAGKSPKHRLSDTDMAERTSSVSERFGQGIAEKHIDLDSSGGSYDEPVRPSSVSSIGSVGGQSSTGSVIDLTDIGESHVKKLENSLDSIMLKESRAGSVNVSSSVNVNSHMTGAEMMDMHIHMPEFHHNQNQMLSNDGSMGTDFQSPPPAWGSRQTPPTPTARNSPHHGVLPKNEKISTSLEELLLSGPGGREAEGPNSLHARRNSQPRRHNLKRQNSLGRSSIDSTGGDVFSPMMTSPSHNQLPSPSPFPASPNHMISPGSFPLMSPTTNHPLAISPNHMFSIANVKSESGIIDAKTGIIGGIGSQMAASMALSRATVNCVPHVVTSSGKPSISALKAQLELKNDVNLSGCTVTQVKEIRQEDVSSSTNSQHPVMKLKLSNMRQYEGSSPPEIKASKSRSSTFDFHSDDDEFTLPLVDKITVVSASPTRLQISNKSTIASFNKFNKSEKFKRKEREKELKKTLSSDSGKRKRDRDESKKERKKKKMSNNSSYSLENEMAVYKSTTVDVEGGDNDKNKPMPKLKITKSGIKMSIENSVFKVKEVKTEEKDVKLKVENIKLEKEAVVKIEKVEKLHVAKKIDKDKLLNLTVKSAKENKETKEKDKNSEKACIPVARTPSASDEGIFDRINAMKTESLNKGENEIIAAKNSPLNNNTSVNSKKSSSSSRSQKSHKSQRSNSNTSKSDSKISRTPTIKLKPIVVPTTGSSVSLTRTPTTPTTQKSITQSPTSTTIGKIGAVSLATSGSQKQLTSSSSSKSPQGQACGKLPNSSSKSSSSGSSSSTSSSKSSSNLQKSVQIQGSSGKNSPVPQTSKPGHSRSSSVSSSSGSSSKSEKSLNKSLSSVSSRTSSPLSERDRDKSKSSSSSSRSSSSSGRDRDKSTSSKNSVPVTTVITQETAASVLSFLNPKAKTIASLPPIPKLSSTSGSQKASTPTSSTTSAIVSTTVTTSTPSSNSKFVKGNSSSSSFSKGTNSSFSSSAGKSSSSSNSSSSVSKGNSSFSKANSSNYSSHSNNRPQNLSVTSTANSNRPGSNSPINYSQKNSNQYNNKGNSNSSSSSTGFRNNSSSSSSSSNSSQNSRNSGQTSSRGNNSGTAFGNKGGNQSQSGQNTHRGTNSSPSNKGSNNAVPGSGNRANVTSNSSNVSNFRGSNSGVTAPKGPGPPNSQSGSNSANTYDNSVKIKPANPQSLSSPGAARGRKGSLSAVIDKLTCKAAIPSAPGSTSQSSQKDKVIINDSPASPEPEVPGLGKKEEKKVVIFEAPASPEPEISTNLSNNINGNRTSSVNSKIVSIPLDEPCNDSSNNSGQNSVHGNCVDNGKVKPNFPKLLNIPISANSSPKIIPLHSPKEKSSPVQTPPIQKKVRSNKSLTKQNSVEHLQQNGEVLHVEDSKASSPTSATKSSKDAYFSTNRNRSSLPADLTGGKNNCEKNKDSVFKIPTPKSVEEIENHQEDVENLVGRRNKVRSGSNFKAISNPSSPVSSPENGLIIDCPSSPRHLQNKTNSPQCNPVSECPENRTSPIFFKLKSSSSSKLKSSPVSSPLGKDTSNADSVSNSPCFLDDDDLMDEALGLGN